MPTKSHISHYCKIYVLITVLLYCCRYYCIIELLYCYRYTVSSRSSTSSRTRWCYASWSWSSWRVWKVHLKKVLLRIWPRPFGPDWKPCKYGQFQASIGVAGSVSALGCSCHLQQYTDRRLYGGEHTAADSLFSDPLRSGGVGDNGSRIHQRGGRCTAMVEFHLQPVSDHLW